MSPPPERAAEDEGDAAGAAQGSEPEAEAAERSELATVDRTLALHLATELDAGYGNASAWHTQW
eukprot:1489712-Prymnesium_polylepis.1